MEPSKLLFVRRDNIGDLICTTPAIHAVRERFPKATIGVLVNTYNVDVIVNNPDIDRIYAYEKAKHAPDKHRAGVYWRNMRTLLAIRRERYDIAIGCGSYSPRLARYTFFTGAPVRIGWLKQGSRTIFYNRPILGAVPGGHEVEATFDLVRPLGISGDPGDMILLPDAVELGKFSSTRDGYLSGSKQRLVAVAISARIGKNKWPLRKFISLITRILDEGGAGVLLLWAPGSRGNPTFPGDDESARMIIEHFGNMILPYPTPTLGALIAAIALSDCVVTLDTGSLHMAAALKRPTVALMTKSKASRWYPWHTRSVVLTAEHVVEDISVDDVVNAVKTVVVGGTAVEMPPP